MSPITSHILDTTLGKPAHGVAVILEVSDGADRWSELGRAVTDRDGRISAFDPQVKNVDRRAYRLRFGTGAYFAATHARTFYPEVHVVFQIDDPSQHYHIPLLVSPFGYSTYRGS